MRRNRSTLFLGILLILIGIWLVASREVPALQQWMNVSFSWPVWIIGAGLLIFIIGLLVGSPSMAIPASIVTGVGCILYYQNTNDDFVSWSYMWTLIPGFVGVGLILTGLLGENSRTNISSGLNLIVISIVLFLIFGTFFGGLAILGPYGPAILIIALGVYILVRGFLRPKRGQNETR